MVGFYFTTSGSTGLYARALSAFSVGCTRSRSVCDGYSRVTLVDWRPHLRSFHKTLHFLSNLGGPGNVWLLVKLLFGRMYTLWVCFKGVSSGSKNFQMPRFESQIWSVLRWKHKWQLNVPCKTCM